MLNHQINGALINAALFLTMVAVAGIAAGNHWAVVFAIASAGAASLCYTAQMWLGDKSSVSWGLHIGSNLLAVFAAVAFGGGVCWLMAALAILKRSLPIDSPLRTRKARSDIGVKRGPRAKPIVRKPRDRDITIGERHGSLVVLAKMHGCDNRHPRFMVRCDCSKEYETGGDSFRACNSCLPCSKRGKFKHGRHTLDFPLYRSWSAMRHRCKNAKLPRWGGRGIRVCMEWAESFQAFSEWAISHGYREGLSLDRVNVDGNYEPSNCEWVTKAENSRRMRANYVLISRSEYERPLRTSGQKCQP